MATSILLGIEQQRQNVLMSINGCEDGCCQMSLATKSRPTKWYWDCWSIYMWPNIRIMIEFRCKCIWAKLSVTSITRMMSEFVSEPYHVAPYQRPPNVRRICGSLGRWWEYKRVFGTSHKLKSPTRSAIGNKHIKCSMLKTKCNSPNL